MNEPIYNIREWTNEHADGLSISERVNLIRIQDMEAGKLVKYEPPKDEDKPVLSVEVKQFSFVACVTTTCIVVVTAAEQGAFAAAATVGGYIVAIGGGVGLAWVILKSCFTWTPDEPATGEPKKEEWEFYQEQRQGWRKKA